MSTPTGIKVENVDESTKSQHDDADSEVVGEEPTHTDGAEAPADAVEQSEQRKSVRIKTLTERGRSNKLDQSLRSFSSRLAALMKESIYVNSLLSAETLDISTLKQAKVNFTGVWSTVVDIFHDIEELSGGVAELKVQEKFEKAEKMSMELLNTLGVEIRQISQESRSNLSGATRSSKASKLAEAAAELAVKKTKLKYLKLEAEQKARLAQLEAEKEIEMAQARVDALSAVGRASDIDSRDVPDVPEVDKEVLVKNYLNNNSQIISRDPAINTLCN